MESNKKNTLIEYWLLLIYLVINSLFILKYAPTIGLSVYSLFFYSACVLLFCFLYKKPLKWLEPVKQKIWLPFLAMVLVLVFLYFRIDPLTVKSDRWSALYFWSDYFVHGKYPYAAHTHLPGGYGSPFPIWQLLHLPFYFLGDEIWAHLLLLIILFFFLRKRKELVDGFLFFTLMLLSPAYWWEVLVRSDLLNNMMVTMLLLFWIRENEIKLRQSPIVLGLLVGLLCCSRIFLFIPFLIFFVPKLLTWNWQTNLKFFLAWLMGLIVPFVPFLFWDANMLLHFPYNPITLQIRQGSLLTFGIGIIVLSFVSFVWRNYFQYLSLVATFCFLFISMMFIRACGYSGIVSCIFMDNFDLSYFSISLPFVWIGYCYYRGKCFN